MKTRITILLILTTVCVWAQDNNEPKDVLSNREIKLNVGYLANGFLEVFYEQITSNKSAIGISAGYALDKSIDYNFSIVPYYRFYFGKKRAAGFFVEPQGAFYSEESNKDSNTNKLGLGLGVSGGGKFIIKKGWTFELFAGGGRNFINNNDITKAYARIGLLVGKQF